MRLQNITEIPLWNDLFDVIIIIMKQATVRKDRLCVHDVFVLNTLIQKRMEFNWEAHLAFRPIVYDKASDLM